MSEEKVGCAKILKIYRDSFSKSALGKKDLGVFGLDDLAEGRAREFKMTELCRELNSKGIGKQGNSITCESCGGKKLYKGLSARKLKFDCGEIELKRAYYVCPKCKASSIPLDEELNLAPEMEQGRLREKISLLSTLVSYHQVPEVSRILLGNEVHAASARRALLKEAELVESECPIKELSPSQSSTLYMEVDGFMCPTREPRKNKEDQGYREAKACQAFLAESVAEQSPNRNTITEQILEVEICSAKVFRKTFQDVYQRANAREANQVVVLADGARWIWNLCKDVCPRAVQILDFFHAKQHLYYAAKILFEESPEKITPWVKQRETWLLEDEIGKVIDDLESYLKYIPEISRELGYFKKNKKRMLYKTFKDKGFYIASGAIESAGKRLAQGRVKGAGMRWNVKDLNPLLMLRAALFDGRVKEHWKHQRGIEDQYFQTLAA